MMTWRAWLVLPAVLVAGPPARAEALLTLPPGWSQSPRREPDRQGQVRREQTATFRLGPLTYAVRYNATVKPEDPAFVDPGEGPVGMPAPCSEGWYHGGFCFLELNGQEVGHSPLSSFLAAEHSPRGIADLVWHHPLADVRYRFVGLAGDDKLLLQIDLDPKQELTRLRLVLRAYPSFFTSWNKREGARRVLSPAGLVEEGQRRSLTAAEGWWAVLYDDVFDPAKGEGKGPCAVAFDPAGIQQIQVVPDSYPVTLNVDLEPAARRISLALWEFPEQPNAAVLERFPAAAEQARAALDQDLRPARLHDFDHAAASAEIERDLATPVVAEQLGAKLKQVQAWLASSKDAFAPAGTPSIAATEEFLSGLDGYEQVLWEARLAELLAF